MVKNLSPEFKEQMVRPKGRNALPRKNYTIKMPSALQMALKQKGADWVRRSLCIALLKEGAIAIEELAIAGLVDRQLVDELGEDSSEVP